MLNWAILGAGGIARVLCNAMRFSKTGEVIAVASRDGSGAKALARDFAIPKWYAGYDTLLADETIDVIYISTIHPTHAELAINAARAGKHILVEKPMAMNHDEALAMVEAARQNDVFLMEAFMYRCHPQTAKVVELVRAGRIGEVRLIRAALSFQAPFDPDSRLYAQELGGGGILDVGCYPASGSRLFAGAAAGVPFLDPIEVKACALLGPTGVDHYTAATVQFENGIIAELIAGVANEMPHQLAIYGSEGVISLPEPWLPSSPARNAAQPLPLDTPFPPARIHVDFHDGRPTQEILVEADRDLFTYEVDTVAQHIADRQAPAMSWQDTLSNMRLLDRWRQEIGLVYAADAQV